MAVAVATTGVGDARDSKGTRKGKTTGTRKGSHMNQDQAKGKWDQIKGRAKEAWGVLTDDDFKKAEGSIEKLYGVIEQKVGDSKETIRTKLDKLHAENKKSPCCG